MRLAVGTLRRAKLDAVRGAVEHLRALPWPTGEPLEIVPIAVPSGVSDMPMSEEEGLAGAANRARAALSATGAELALGLEGGVVVVDREQPLLILRNWAAAWDGRRLWYGSGPGIQLPAELAETVLGGEELGVAIDRYAGEHDIRSGRGTFGVLTADLLDRAHAFEDAVVAALAPWYVTMT
ncbi:MAG TPA: DUF84 family protein [Acidobacteria bacterium]|nr:DUF84 family protein [Acidobacteriota bacterium]